MKTVDFDALRRQLHEERTRRYAKVLLDVEDKLKFELVTPFVDEYGQAVFGRWGGWLLGINEMVFNERLVLWRESDGGPRGMNVPSFGWCYPKSGRATLALIVFDPATMGEPCGYAKRALAQRLPGQTADDVPNSWY